MTKKILLTSVFKPFGVDNVYSRKESKIEIYHNQLTKNQGIYSLRSFMSTFGLHAIANNIDAPATVLDFPTLGRFTREIKKGYNIVGIGAILPNFQKVKKMVEIIRAVSPQTTVVLGGFCAAIPDIQETMGVDYVCLGEGIQFMRHLLGEPEGFEFKNPDTGIENREIFGVPLRFSRHPYIVVGLGCSYGCDFCAPSHFFGKRHIRFFKDGKTLFEEIERVSRIFKSEIVSLMGDDNFLLDEKRAEELRQCVVQSGKTYSLFIFSSADKIAVFGAERLAEMGVNVIWIGRESRFSNYSKNRGVDLKKIVAELRAYGIKVILSSILLTDEHTLENIETDIQDHLDCRPVFSQFAFFSPSPGTPLFDRMEKENRILTAIPFEEWHAFKQPWFIHPAFNLTEAEKIQTDAYDRDFYELGPSLMRYFEVEYEGWKNLKDSDKPHLAARAEYFADNMRQYKIILYAMQLLLRDADMKKRVCEVLEKIESSFGKTAGFEKTAAWGLYAFGRSREIRTRLWGDTLQPPTRIVRYKGRD